MPHMDGKVLMRSPPPGHPRKTSKLWGGTRRCRLHPHRIVAGRRHLCVDGYGNACVHKFSPDRTKRILTWGMSGAFRNPGTILNLPHPSPQYPCDARMCLRDDRENHPRADLRPQGQIQSQWNKPAPAENAFHAGRTCHIVYRG